jgi:hypothetical protein
MFSRVRSASQKLKKFVRDVRDPYDDGRDAALERAWNDMPENLRQPNQTLGVQIPGCAATHNIMEKCNFSCTACYLSKEANDTPPLPFAEVKSQLDKIRAHLGPWGNTQLTAGEVTLMPVDDLVKITKYCHDVQLSAMVMTHGDTFREDPTYLERLVTEGNLEKVAIHVDTTQRGRAGLRGKEKNLKERDLHPIRDEFAQLVKDTRRKTGKTLHAAHTYTVDPSNLDGVPDVMDWVLDNSDAYRMISFQPTAEVGRTRTGRMTESRDLVWSKIEEGCGKAINHQPYLFGHPDCNDVTLFFVVKFGGERHIVEVTRPEEPVDAAFLQRLLHCGFTGFSPDGQPGLEQLAKIIGRTIRDPAGLAAAIGYCGYRSWTERSWLPKLLATIARGEPWEVNPFVIVVHHFMSADMLDTPVGKARLEACTFRLPVGDEMIPMCTMNGTDLRLKTNRETQERLGTAAPVAA